MQSKLPVRLFRTLLKGTRALRKPFAAELLAVCVDLTLTPYLSPLSGFEVDESRKAEALNLHAWTRDGLVTPSDALKKAFREGKDKDIDRLLELMPVILRYSRAACLIEEYLVEQSKNTNSVSLIPASLLVSKLKYQNERGKRVGEIVESGLQELLVEFKREVGQSKYRANRNIDRLKAFNVVIQRKEQNRSLGEDPCHLVDQVLDSNFQYSNAMPITFCIVFAEIMERLGVKTRGVAFPKRFVTRIFNPPESSFSSSSSSTKDAHIDVDVDEDAVAGGKEGTGAGAALSKYIKVNDLVGRWIGQYPAGLQEIEVSYNELEGFVEAKKVDGDLFVPEGEITWRFECLSETIDVESDKLGQLQIAREGFKSKTFIPCHIKANVLTPRSIGDFRVNAPVFTELVLDVLDDETGDTGFSTSHSSSKSKSSRSSVKSLHFVRVTDLDRCLVSFLLGSVSLLTPLQYLDFVKRTGMEMQDSSIRKILKSASSDDVVARLSGNLAAMYERSDKLGDYTYWTSVRRLFDGNSKKKEERKLEE